jgi:hypothetical protein
MLDIVNLIWMLFTSVLAITASESRRVIVTRAYYYAICAYAPVNVLYQIFFNDNDELSGIIFVGFVVMNVLM